MVTKTDDDHIDDLVGQAVDEYFQRLKRGEQPQLDDFVSQYPEVKGILETVIPGLQAAEPSASLSADDKVTFDTPKHLGDFRILRQIGRGGMGIVYEAEQISMARRVALKVLPLAGLVDELKIRRFQNEVRAVAALDHPNIVSVYMVGEERGVHYYAMQLIRGRSLSEVISSLRHVRSEGEPFNGTSIIRLMSHEKVDNQTGSVIKTYADPEDTGTNREADAATIGTDIKANTSTLPHSSRREYYRSVAALGIQAAMALQHAHDEGIVHRDIKPDNLLLDSSSKLYVTDFGLARIESEIGVTMTGDVIGTLRYMAPEQALGKRPVDQRADIYSLGVTLYELITLQPAYRAVDRQELLKQIAFEDPTPLRRFDRDAPTEFETIIHKAMSKDVEDRYNSAQELADDLRSHLENRPIKAKPPTPLQIMGKWTRRNATLTWTIIVALSLITLTLAFSTVLVSNHLVRATKAQDQANARAMQLERRNYLLHIANADKAITAERYVVAQAELDMCKSDLRGWEWRFLVDRIQEVFPGSFPGSQHAHFTRNGKRMIAIGPNRKSGHSKVNIWHLKTRKIVRDFEHDHALRYIALAPNERSIAAQDTRGRVIVWDLESGKTPAIVQAHKTLPGNNASGLAYSRDGDRIASISNAGELVVIDARNLQIEFRMQLNEKEFRKASFSPDGRWLLIGSSGEARGIIVDMESRKIAARFPADREDHVPTFGPKGQRIYTGGSDGSITVWTWDGKSLDEVGPWATSLRDAKNTFGLDISDDGTRLVSTSWPSYVQILDTQTGQQLAQLDAGDIVYWSAFNHDGTVVALYSTSGGIRLWRWNWQEQEAARQVKVLEGAAKVSFDAGGNQILVSTPMYFIGGTERLYHIFTPEPAVVLNVGALSRVVTLDESVYEASWLPGNRKIVATAATDDAIRLYDVTSGERVTDFSFTPDLTISRAAPDEYHVLTFSKPGTLRSVNLISGEAEEFDEPLTPTWAAGANISRGGELIAFSTFDFHGHIWSTAPKRRISQFVTSGHWMKRLIFSDNADRLYVGGTGGLLIEVDVATGKITREFVGHVGTVLGIATSPDRRQLVSGDYSSGQVLLWDLTTSQQVLTLSSGGAGIVSLDWSSDGQRIAAGKRDGTVQVWTLPSSP